MVPTSIFKFYISRLAGCCKSIAKHFAAVQGAGTLTSAFPWVLVEQQRPIEQVRLTQMEKRGWEGIALSGVDCAQEEAGSVAVAHSKS